MRRLWLLATRAYKGFGAHNSTQMAAAISYYFLFALVPLAMFLVSIFGLVAGSDDSHQSLADEVTDYLEVGAGEPVLELSEDAFVRIEEQYGRAGLAEIEKELADLNESGDSGEERRRMADTLDAGGTVTVANRQLQPEDLSAGQDNLITDTLDNVSQASVPLGVIGLVMVAYSASVLFGAVRRSLNFVWGVDAQRPLVQQKLIDLAMLLGLALLLLASVAATAALQTVREMNSGPISSSGGIFWSLLPFAAPWAVTFLLYLFTFRFVPNARNRFRDVWLGAALAATAFEVLKYGYAIYVANFGHYDVVYGALGGILLFMFFTYLVAYTFLLGAEVAFEYPRVLRGGFDEDEGQPEDGRSLAERILSGVRGLFLAKRD
ncbi:MAG: YihY/virulence factor BrkB family protein [Chloroflexi bacterium]|nr:YihY/virulence factor BrkB family protein [Chloroflexota bacterium]